jgi:hypothetical protein
MHISKEVFDEIKTFDSYGDYLAKANQNLNPYYFIGSTESNYESKPVTVDSGTLKGILADLLFFYHKEADGAYCSASAHFDRALVELSDLTGNPFRNDPLIQEAYQEIDLLREMVKFNK